MDIRKKKFTEHQLDRRQRRDESEFNWEGEEQAGPTRDYNTRNEDCYDSHVSLCI